MLLPLLLQLLALLLLVLKPKTLNLKSQTWLERASPSRIRFLVFFLP